MDSRLRRLLTPPAGAPAPVHPLVRRGILAVLGLGCGISPLFFGYFDISAWGPIGIGLIALAIALLLARQTLPRGIAGLAVLGLLAYGAWCLLSMGWAESGDRALTEGDRWLLCGVYLLDLALLLDDRRDAQVLLAGAVAGILGVAAYDFAEMLNGNRDLFIGSRLLEPLGYVNGLGGFFLLGLWPLLAVAERVRHPLAAGAAAGGATLLTALVLLTESRGTAFAFIASAAVLLVLLPGRNRRAWAILTVLGALLLAWGPLTDVTREIPGGIPAQPAATIEAGAQAALLVAAVAGVLWGLGTWIVDTFSARSPEIGRQLPRASGILLVVAASAAALTIAVSIEDPAGKVSDQYDAFTQLEPVKGGSRFTSGGGNRYDYWRIAWHQFTADPIDGIGAGNFDRTYFLERQTNEDVRQAHSIEMQTLGDTGLIGAVLLGTFLVAVGIGAWRSASLARRREGEIGLVVAALGTFVVWLAQTSVDWLHLIPGLTGLALGAAAILLRASSEDERRGRVALPTLALAAPLLLAAIAILLIGRPTIAEHLRAQAQEEMRADPRAALAAADESLSLNADSLQGYYLRGAAQARLGNFGSARESLQEAIEREPHNYVTWGLLGDLLTRRGSIPAAIRAYRRASQLNPRDRGLRLLASQPSAVERLSRKPETSGF